MMASFILCLLPALLATTRAQDALKCNLCTNSRTCRNPKTCEGSKLKGGCLTVAEENTLAPDGTEATGLSRGCVDYSNRVPKKSISFTVGTDKYLRIDAILCRTRDYCNGGIWGVSRKNNTFNGWQCPTCFDLSPAPCEGRAALCRGAETHCIDFTGTITSASSTAGTPFTGKGCATASTKSITDGTTLVSTVSTYVFTNVTSTVAQKATITPEPTITPKSTITRKPTITTKATTTATTAAKATTATTSGGSPALGKFSFALYLPGLAELLLVKLLLSPAPDACEL